MLAILWIGACFLSLAFGGAAAPTRLDTGYVELLPRAPSLSLSLTESHVLNGDGSLREWHFGLSVHEQGSPVFGDTAQYYNLVLRKRKKCMEFQQTSPPGVTERITGHPVVTTNLIAKNNEGDNQQLLAAVQSRIPQNVESKIVPSMPDDFVNCLDYAAYATERLFKDGYVSVDGFEKIKGWWAEKKDEVRRMTNPEIFRLCGFKEAGQLQSRSIRCPKASRKAKPTGKPKKTASISPGKSKTGKPAGTRGRRPTQVTKAKKKVKAVARGKGAAQKGPSKGRPAPMKSKTAPTRKLRK
ncbi:hypothetical protein NMY22_g16564 [Coprinellus aureogranulatus]|nr:hypothetical protein NMY22_g16564 [Coprinellus aureogranulatus]